LPHAGALVAKLLSLRHSGAVLTDPYIFFAVVKKIKFVSPVIRNITNIHYQNHVVFVIINWICSRSKEKRVEREYTTPYWILLDFRKSENQLDFL